MKILRILLTSTICALVLLQPIFAILAESRIDFRIRRPASRDAHAPGEVIVKVKKGSRGSWASMRQLENATSEPLIEFPAEGVLSDVIDRNGLDRIFVIKFDPSQDLEPVLTDLRATGLFEYAEPNYLITPGSAARDESANGIPDDPGFSEQWALRNLGLSVEGFPAKLDADIRALAAWSITRGSSDVLVAVSDTGVDIAHPDLAPSIYRNEGEIPDNGRDDDNNGFADDVHGYNVANRNGDVSDILGHGTQMAGIIAGITNNRIGISGLSQSRILPVRFFKRTGPNPTDLEGTVADAARSILYAIAAGATIINASWSTSLSPPVSQESAQALRDAVQASHDAGVLLVCIAGNHGGSIDANPLFPASYQLPNQIVVAASDFTDEIWHLFGNRFAIKSGFGVRTVHLAAPGVSVFTTMARGDCPLCSASEDPDNWYGFINGTSASAAYVSGVAALVKAHFPDSNHILLRRRIVEGVDLIDHLRDLVASGGRLNAEKALAVQLAISQPALSKVKYKAGSEKMILLGEGLVEGAFVLVGNKPFPTRVKGGDLSRLLATVPAAALPVGTPVEIRFRNPDGGTSAPYTFTR